MFVTDFLDKCFEMNKKLPKGRNSKVDYKNFNGTETYEKSASFIQKLGKNFEI